MYPLVDARRRRTRFWCVARQFAVCPFLLFFLISLPQQLVDMISTMLASNFANPSLITVEVVEAVKDRIVTCFLRQVVLVSGDGDFGYALSRLRLLKFNVVVVKQQGRSGSRHLELQVRFLLVTPLLDLCVCVRARACSLFCSFSCSASFFCSYSHATQTGGPCSLMGANPRAPQR